MTGGLESIAGIQSNESLNLSDDLIVYRRPWEKDAEHDQRSRWERYARELGRNGGRIDIVQEIRD